MSARLKKTRASGRNVGKVFNPVVKLVLENQPFPMGTVARLHGCCIKVVNMQEGANLFGMPRL